MPDGSRGIFVYTCGHQASREPVNAYGKAPWRYFRWCARRGLNADADSLSDVKQDARQRGVRGETFPYWNLRRRGSVFAARNYVPRDVKGEIDLIGYDGETAGARGSVGAVRGECGGGETASGWPYGA